METMRISWGDPSLGVIPRFLKVTRLSSGFPIPTHSFTKCPQGLSRTHQVSPESTRSPLGLHRFFPTRSPQSITLLIVHNFVHCQQLCSLSTCLPRVSLGLHRVSPDLPRVFPGLFRVSPSLPKVTPAPMNDLRTQQRLELDKSA